MEHEVTFEGFKTIELPNIPIMQANLPEPVMTYLWQLIDVAKANPKDLKGGLAGNISTSFELHDEQNIFETFCVPSLSVELNLKSSPSIEISKFFSWSVLLNLISTEPSLFSTIKLGSVELDM